MNVFSFCSFTLYEVRLNYIYRIRLCLLIDYKMISKSAF